MIQMNKFIENCTFCCRWMVDIRSYLER